MQTTESFDNALDTFVQYLHGVFDEAYSTPQIISIDNNTKFIRIAQAGMNAPDNRSVYCFIDANGEIWKPASWKGPTKNFSRGSIFNATTWAGYSPWGI